ncbi:MAG: hypothetical protein HWN81_18650 [Candidatus Lokiarchaeota archaeon]|nr:hypothetical protein [Candidatus Lokiarchaeota archaeon]
MIRISSFFETIKENNAITGIILSIVITFLFIVVSPQWYGLVLLRDFDFAIGLFFGTLFALKYRQPHQSALKFGLRLGIISGVLAAIAPSFFYWIAYRLEIIFLFQYLGGLIVTGLVIGFIMGGFLGWFYMSKDTPKKGEEKYNDDFFEDLVDK